MADDLATLAAQLLASIEAAARNSPDNLAARVTGNPEEARIRAYLEHLGTEQVKLLLQVDGFGNPADRRLARQWIADSDREAKAAKRAARALERANIRATIALIVAAIGIVLSTIITAAGIYITHRDIAVRAGTTEQRTLR